MILHATINLIQLTEAFISLHILETLHDITLIHFNTNIFHILDPQDMILKRLIHFN